MKKFITVALVTILIFTVVGAVRAQENVELPSPGITPDSPFYFLDTLGERIGLLFARSAEAKARKALAIAEEKLAETEAMVDEGKDKAAEIAINRYGETISEAARALAQAAQTGEGFDEALKSLIAKATSIHLGVLSRVYEKVPEKAQEVIQRAMEKSSRGGEEALEAIEATEARERVQEEIQERRQEVEQRLEQLREEGKPIPVLPPFGPIEGEEEDEEGVPAGGVPAPAGERGR